jgi:hypothetical protein
MTSFREDFGIESFEAGRGRWHARIRRANQKPLIINGVAFPHLEVGSAWPTGRPRSGTHRLTLIVVSDHGHRTVTRPEFNSPPTLNGAKGTA